MHSTDSRVVDYAKGVVELERVVESVGKDERPHCQDQDDRKQRGLFIEPLLPRHGRTAGPRGAEF